MHAGDDFAATALRLRHVFHDVGVHSLTLQPEYYPCAKGRSVCGVSDCSFLKEETENFLPNVLNEGEIAESDEGRVMDSLPQNEYSCDTPTSDYPERSPVNQPCKFSCVSNDCAAYMCCGRFAKEKGAFIVGCNRRR
uniref:Uncharacterized protein n=1 Tax=Ciona savignyi TaxID=51511 RepID=H2YQ77_CIOSA